jgi:periplasmic divalent cation tolerance protein
MGTTFWNTRVETKQIQNNAEDPLVLVMTSFSDKKQAKVLAQSLLESRLVACCNILPAIWSTYRWQDEICEENECLLLMKTLRSQYSSLEVFIQTRHPYDVPELICIETDAVMQEYYLWLKQQVSPNSPC